MRFKGIVKYLNGLNTYVLRGDDGKRFNPTKRLPVKFQQDTIAVVVEGILREDLGGPNLYGTALDVSVITLADSYISPEDKQAIALTLARMTAFDSKDLAKLQAIDVMAAKLTPESFQNWFGSGNYTFALHYLETDLPAGPYSDAMPITGFCLYSRDLVNGMDMSGNSSRYTLMKFTIAKVDGGWKFTSTGKYIPEAGVDPNQFVADLLDKAKKKYGTTNLAEWTPLSVPVQQGPELKNRK